MKFVPQLIAVKLVVIFSLVLGCPQWSLENRPMVVMSKPANG